jgi:hypothetical protein
MIARSAKIKSAFPGAKLALLCVHHSLAPDPSHMIKSSIQRALATKRWTIRAINVIGAIAVTIVIMWQTGLTSKEWWDKTTAPKPMPVAKAPVQPPTKAIGIAPPAPKGNDTSSSTVPLPLFLVQANPGDGTAQIGAVRESPQTYRTGALLENGARLAEIHAEYVLLRKGARSVRLYLENAPASRKFAGDALTMVGPIPVPPPPVRAMSREVLTDYLRPSPVYEGESLAGYQVYAGPKSGPFTQMGLQPGDLIVEVDGTRLTDPSASWDILRELTEGTVLSAVVKRHGETAQVSLDGTLIVRAEEAKGQQLTQAMLSPSTQ